MVLLSERSLRLPLGSIVHYKDSELKTRGYDFITVKNTDENQSKEEVYRAGSMRILSKNGPVVLSQPNHGQS